MLDRLVEEALAHNQDLALAVARVDEARAFAAGRGFAPAMPSVDATLQARPLALLRASPSMPLPPGTPIESNNYRAQLNVAYEVDLWGRLQSGSNAARANLLATEAARETVRIALATEVVRGYYTLVALDAQIAATARSLELRSDGLELQKVRAKAGLINDFSLRQLEAEVAAAQCPAAGARRRTAPRRSWRSRCSPAAARAPSWRARSSAAPEQGEPQPPVVPEGLPSDLLLRRPDIVEAEQRLIAANARIAEARAALFPRIVLTGYLGSESAALGDLFSGPATIWSLAFGLAQPIFQGGRLFAEIDAVKARERQAVAQYQKTLQEAFREVRQALSTQLRAREVFDAETNARRRADRSPAARAHPLPERAAVPARGHRRRAQPAAGGVEPRGRAARAARRGGRRRQGAGRRVAGAGGDARGAEEPLTFLVQCGVRPVSQA